MTTQSKTFTLILNQIKGERKVVDRAPEGTSVDLIRLKTKFPAIAASLTRTGVKVTLTAKVDEETGKPYIAQHPNECVEFQCCTGLEKVEHSMKTKALMSKKGPAKLMTLDLSYKNPDGSVGERCKNLVFRAKGDEHLSAPICDGCRGATQESGGNLPVDVLGLLGFDVNEV